MRIQQSKNVPRKWHRQATDEKALLAFIYFVEGFPSIEVGEFSMADVEAVERFVSG